MESTLESTFEAVDTAEEAVRAFIRDTSFTDDDQYFISLAAREILVNAVKHGNAFDPNKKAGLRLSKDDGRLTIEVTDEGSGYRVEDIPDPLAPENLERESGRGVTMARNIMDDFVVEQNAPHGTRVRMSKKLP